MCCGRHSRHIGNMTRKWEKWTCKLALLQNMWTLITFTNKMQHFYSAVFYVKYILCNTMGNRDEETIAVRLIQPWSMKPKCALVNRWLHYGNQIMLWVYVFFCSCLLFFLLKKFCSNVGKCFFLCHFEKIDHFPKSQGPERKFSDSFESLSLSISRRFLDVVCFFTRDGIKSSC